MNVYVKEITSNNFKYIQPDNQYSAYMIPDVFTNPNVVGTQGFIIDPSYNHYLSGIYKDETLGPNEPMTYGIVHTLPYTDVNTTSDLITITDNILKETDIITITSSGTMPSPLVSGQEYSVYNRTSTDIQLLAVSTDTVPINITTQGSGTLTIRKKWKLSYFDLHDYYTIVDANGITLDYTGYGFRCNSKANFLQDVKTYINNVAPISLPDWRSALILFCNVDKQIGDANVKAYITFVYQGNQGVLL